jgi:hypothetical protein
MAKFKDKYPTSVCSLTKPLFSINPDDIGPDDIGCVKTSIALFDNWSYGIYPRTFPNSLEHKNTKVFWIDTVEYDIV